MKEQTVTLFATEFETIFVTETTLFSRSGAFKRLAAPVIESLQIPFADLEAALKQQPQLAKGDLLTSRGVSAIIAGARRFRPPNRLGSVQSEQCYSLLVSEGTHLDLQQLLGEGATSSTGGSPAWKWEVKRSEGLAPIAFYIMQPQSDNLLVCNSLSLLRAVGGAYASPSRTPNASSLSNPPWRQARSSPTWGYRSYRHREPSADDASGRSLVGPDAEALLFSFDSASGTASLEYFSSSPSDSTAEALRNKNFLPPFQRIGDRVWKTTIALSNDQAHLGYLFFIMGMFGFGVYL